MGGGHGSTFDRATYDKFLKCFNKYGDETILESQRSAWKGISDYWETRYENKNYKGEPDPWFQPSHFREAYRRSY